MEEWLNRLNKLYKMLKKLHLMNSKIIQIGLEKVNYIQFKTKNIPKLKNPMLDLGSKIVQTLDKKELFLDVDTVIVENQPALKNPNYEERSDVIIFLFFDKRFY